MPTIHVSSLALMEATVAAVGASHLVTLINLGTPVPRPATIAADRHLQLSINDITEAIEGQIPPGERDMAALIGFVDSWDRVKPLVVHCYAGVSRSTAGAFISMCRIAPHRDEAEIAGALRRASPSAFPNPLMIRLADQLMGRDGRMVAAIAGIGRGTDFSDAQPFMLPHA